MDLVRSICGSDPPRDPLGIGARWITTKEQAFEIDWRDGSDRYSRTTQCLSSGRHVKIIPDTGLNLPKGMVVFQDLESGMLHVTSGDSVEELIDCGWRPL